MNGRKSQAILAQAEGNREDGKQLTSCRVLLTLDKVRNSASRC
jgi:hypothetical protein